MKILICGVPKSGKTTLCKQIGKEFPSFNIISGEALRNGFQKMDKVHYKEWGDKFSKQREEDFPTFLKEFTEWNEFFTGNNTILDLAILNLKDIAQVASANDKIICLGFGGKDEKEMFDIIRSYEHKQDYTADMSNEDLMKLWGNIAQEDKNNIDFSDKNKISYYDTSFDREIVFEKILKDLSMLKKELK